MYSKFSRETLEGVGGMAKYDLHKIMHDSSDKTDIASVQCLQVDSKSDYYDMGNLVQSLKSHQDKFTIMNLNIESIKSKFDTLLSILTHLKNNGFEFSVITLQETWLRNDADVSHYELPNYNLIAQGTICSRKGGLITYIHKRFDYVIRSLYTSSSWWEGLFIDIKGDSLKRNITVGNIYRPPRDNNNNKSVRNFLTPFAPIIHKLSREKFDSIICGDFNIDLLKIKGRDLFVEFLDLFLSNGFMPKISLPTRFSKKKATIIDQIFCRISDFTTDSHSGIYVTETSDHLPILTCLDIMNIKQSKSQKYITIQINDAKSQANFCNAIAATDTFSQLVNDPLTDPNVNYTKICETIQSLKNEHLPTKTVKFRQEHRYPM